jgi:hypothetical protein
MRDADPPAGFVRFAAGPARVVCAAHVADAFRRAITEAGTLYKYAESHPRARTLTGRGAVYAVPLPGEVEDAVIRHNRHGGLLAPLTGDLFRTPTFAPRELLVSERLHEYGVPTPQMLGYAIYDALPGFKRADVVTREVKNSFDLSAALMSVDAAYRTRALVTTASLVVTLGVIGAQHADLNVKNILLHEESGALHAMVLDVDRVVFDEPEIVFDLNLERLLRSARKWQTVHGAPVTKEELDELGASVRERRPPPVGPTTSW